MSLINNVPKTFLFLNSNLEKETMQLEKETKKLEKAELYLNLINKIESLINNDKVIDCDFSQDFYTVLQSEYPDCLICIKIYNELLDTDLFDFQRNKAQQQILTFLQLFKETLLKSIDKSMTIIKIKQDTLELYQKIIDEFSNDNCKVISNIVFNKLLDIINKSDLDNQKQLELIEELSIANVNLMKQNIELLAMRRRSQTKKNIVPSEIQKTEDLVDSSEEHVKELIIKASEIAHSFSEKTLLVDTVLKEIKNDMSLEDKLLLITSPSDIDNKLLCIAFYIKENLLTRLSEKYFSQDLIVELEFLLLEYDQYLNKIKEEKSVSDIIREYDFLDKSSLYEKIKSFLIDMKNDLYIHYTGQYSEEMYSKLVSGHTDLLTAFNDYEQAIISYAEDTSVESADMVSMIYDTLINKYIEVSKTDKNAINSESTLNQEDIDAGINFYSGNLPVRNIYIFLNDGEEISDIEEEILDDRTLPPNSMSGTISLLKERISIMFALTDDHKVKTENYTDTFKKKYRPKVIKNFKLRVVYSPFNTTLDSRFGFSESPQIIFVLGVYNGRVDPSTKDDSFDKAMKKCYAMKEKIDKIVELLNPDWSKLTNEEIEERTKIIKQYLLLQQARIGHMINSTKSKKERIINGTD